MNNHRRNHHSRRSDNKPYAMLGSGRLTSTLWKSVGPSGCEYRFNLFHTDRETGAVGQWLEPEDIESLVKISRVLAFELAEDGCMDQSMRQRLYQLAEALDELISPEF